MPEGYCYGRVAYLGSLYWLQDGSYRCSRRRVKIRRVGAMSEMRATARTAPVLSKIAS